LALGETPGHMVKESPEPRRGNYLEPLGFGGNPEPSGDGEFPGHPARGSPEPAGDLGDWNTGEVAGPGRWSSGAKDAEKAAGRRREAGEAAASHTCSGLVLLCPKGPNRARTDTPPRPRPFRPAARSRPGSAVGSAVRTRRCRRPVRRPGQATLAGRRDD